MARWKVYQERLPTATEVEAWFSNSHDALCNGKDGWQWKGKVPFRKEIISQPDTMGAVFDFRSGWTRAGENPGEQTVIKVHNEQRLPTTNQYGHPMGGQCYYSAGYGGQPGSGGEAEQYQGLFNPKMGSQFYAYQNAIEVLLSTQNFRLPLYVNGSDWANYRMHWEQRKLFCYGITDTWESSNSVWENFISVSDPALGCNESGFEAFLAYREASGGEAPDWYFDTEKPYVCWGAVAARADRTYYSDASCWIDRLITTMQMWTNPSYADIIRRLRFAAVLVRLGVFEVSQTRILSLQSSINHIISDGPVYKGPDVLILPRNWPPHK